jgi:hypothetical protein
VFLATIEEVQSQTTCVLPFNPAVTVVAHCLKLAKLMLAMDVQRVHRRWLLQKSEGHASAEWRE